MGQRERDGPALAIAGLRLESPEPGGAVGMAEDFVVLHALAAVGGGAAAQLRQAVLGVRLDETEWFEQAVNTVGDPSCLLGKRISGRERRGAREDNFPEPAAQGFDALGG